MEDTKRTDVALHCFERILELDPTREDARGFLRKVHELSQVSSYDSPHIQAFGEVEDSHPYMSKCQSHVPSIFPIF